MSESLDSPPVAVFPLERTRVHRETFVAMPALQHRGQRKATDLSVGMHVLDDQEYESLRNKPKTFEFHLATALFPRGKITAKAVARMVSHRIPGSGKYNFIFHLRGDLAGAVTDELTKAWREIPNPDGHWFLVPHNGNRSTAEARAGQAIPHGQVSSAEIDAALAGATSVRR